MNCELMLTYDTPTLRKTGSRNLMGPKTLQTIWGTYMKLVTKYQISASNSCWEKCDEKCVYMFMSLFPTFISVMTLVDLQHLFLWWPLLTSNIFL